MDIDGGWSKTPHAITNAMPQMTMPELACTMLLVRETYGWHRPRARLRRAPVQIMMLQPGRRIRRMNRSRWSAWRVGRSFCQYGR